MSAVNAGHILTSTSLSSVATLRLYRVLVCIGPTANGPIAYSSVRKVYGAQTGNVRPMSALEEVREAFQQTGKGFQFDNETAAVECKCHQSRYSDTRVMHARIDTLVMAAKGVRTASTRRMIAFSWIQERKRVVAINSGCRFKESPSHASPLHDLIFPPDHHLCGGFFCYIGQLRLPDITILQSVWLGMVENDVLNFPTCPSSQTLSYVPRMTSPPRTWVTTGRLSL